MPSFNAALAALLALMLAGCGLQDEFFGEPEEPPLPGEREAILEVSRGPVADPDIASVPVILPPAEQRAWPVAGGNPAHSGGHLAWNGSPRLAWTTDTGAGTQDAAQRLLAAPVAAGGRVFVLDAVLNLRAFDATNGSPLWAIGTAPEGEEDGFGGGIATDGNIVYATGGHGDVLAVNAADGSLVWRVSLPGPIRAAPMLAGKQLFVVAADNSLYTLDTADGRRGWSLIGTAEGAGLLGAPAPAVAKDVVIAPLSTGEVVVLRAANGRELWRASLGSIRRFDFGTRLSDFGGTPAIAGNTLYASSVAGRTAALSMRAGSRIWEQRLGGSQSLWVAGDFVFLVTDNAELLCLHRPDGRVRWVLPLPRFSDPEDQEGALLYTGPVAAGGQLVLLRSDGRIVLVDPASGQLAQEFSLSASVRLPPVVSDGTLYVLTEDGTLSAFR